MLHHELIQHTNASQILGRSFSLAAHIQTCRLLNINADQREPPCALTQVKEGRQGQKRADTGRKFGGGRRRIWRFWMEDSWHICALCRLCAPDGRGTQTDGRTDRLVAWRALNVNARAARVDSFHRPDTLLMSRTGTPGRNII